MYKILKEFWHFEFFFVLVFVELDWVNRLWKLQINRSLVSEWLKGTLLVYNRQIVSTTYCYSFYIIPLCCYIIVYLLCELPSSCNGYYIKYKTTLRSCDTQHMPDDQRWGGSDRLYGTMMQRRCGGGGGGGGDGWSRRRGGAGIWYDDNRFVIGVGLDLDGSGG